MHLCGRRFRFLSCGFLRFVVGCGLFGVVMAGGGDQRIFCFQGMCARLI